MDLEALKEAVILGDVKGSNLLTEVAIQAGHSPQKILEEALAPAMEIVGDKFRCNEVYVPEVLVAARAMKKSLALLKPLLTQTGVKPVATAVIGTVKGDLHDIGKNLVCMMLEGAGFEVVDVGADVAPEKFVQAVKDTKAQILGISSPAHHHHAGHEGRPEGTGAGRPPQAGEGHGGRRPCDPVLCRRDRRRRLRRERRGGGGQGQGTARHRIR